MGPWHDYEEERDEERNAGENGVLHHQRPREKPNQRRKSPRQAERDCVRPEPRSRRRAVQPTRHDLAPRVDDRRQKPDAHEVQVQRRDGFHQGHRKETTGEQKKHDGDDDLARDSDVNLRRHDRTESCANSPRNEYSSNLRTSKTKAKRGGQKRGREERKEELVMTITGNVPNAKGYLVLVDVCEWLLSSNVQTKGDIKYNQTTLSVKKILPYLYASCLIQYQLSVTCA